MRFILLVVFGLAACSTEGGGEELGVGADLAMPPDPAADLAVSTDGTVACAPRVPTADDAPRWMVVSHPYKEPSGAKSNDYEVLTLASNGEIGRPGYHFTMGRASFGEIVFTPDAQLGYAAQEDGSIGVFRLHANMAPAVIETGHMSGFYAKVLWMSAAGDRLYALDSDTEANNGGIFVMDIACDGSLGPSTKLSAGDVPYAIVGLKNGDVAVYARGLTGSSAGQAAHRVTLSPFARQISVPVFSTKSDDAIVVGAAGTHDSKWVLFGDNAVFSGVPNRVGAVEITAGGLGVAQELTPVKDPVSIATSPYDNAALVVSGVDNAILAFGYDPANTITPFTNKGAITYVGKKPELPYAAIGIDRGALRGMVFIAELSGIRPVRFETDGSITDLGKHALGTTFDDVVGALGVTR